MTFKKRYYEERKAYWRRMYELIATAEGYAHVRIWFTRNGPPLPKTIKMWNDE